MRHARFLALPLALALAACASTEAQAPAAKESGDALAGGSVRERARLQAQRDAEARARSLADAGQADDGFDFGSGPVARTRRPAARPEAGEREAVAGQGIRVVWEGLAVEREQLENPRFGRRPLRGAAPDLKIVLVSQNHPSAIGREQGRAATRDKDGGQVAVLTEKDLRALVRGLREAGFYEVSKPTGSLEPQFADEAARGRVTIEVDGESQTVLSLRGQGSSPATKDVPRVYSEAKQAVAAMRNQTPTLNVLTSGSQKLPTATPRRRGERRVLTAEEAAKILGEEKPAAPAAEDDWLGRTAR